MIRPLLLALAAWTVLGSPAVARDRYGTRSERVEIADLDLSTDAGVRELERRVGRAVRRICGSDHECREGAWASTWEQANAAIARDEWMRRMAAERAAQLRACGPYASPMGCPPPQPAHWAPPQPGVTVIVVSTGGYPVPMPPPMPSPYGYWPR